MTLNQQSYDKIAQVIRKIKANKLLLYFRQSHFYKELDDNSLLRVAHMYEKVKFTNKMMIYKEGDKSLDYCYFLAKGEVSLRKEKKVLSLLE